jgi:type II secretory pathway pseudopilin PulG
VSGAVIIIVLALVALAALGWHTYNQNRKRREQELADAQAEARRWVERLGGQVLNLVGSTDSAKQALADAAERHTAASSQMEQARTAEQCKLTTQTALEGLYYARAARVAMDMDPGPELPSLSEATGAGRVSEYREVQVDGQQQVASPTPSERTPHYYPGGRVSGRPVPEGWYSQPWWKGALVGGAAGVGSFLLMDALFDGMDGVPAAAAGGGDFGGFDGGGFDGGFDGGGFDGGGFDGFDGGDFDGGGFDFGGLDDV